MRNRVRGLLVVLCLCASLAPAGASSTITYTYDQLGRITRVDFAPNQFIVYSYDAAGNRTTVTTSSANNSAPIAINDSVEVHENAAKTFDPRVNDTNPQNATLTITSQTAPAHGTIANNNGTSLTYTPNTSYLGADSLNYTISDGQGHTSTATISITVDNHPPVAVNDSVSVKENAGSDAGSSVTYDPRANDSDPDGDPITIQSVGTPAHGTVTILNNGTSLNYAPAANYIGSDSFSYTINDGLGLTATATDTVSVNNQPPVAVNDTASVNEWVNGVGPQTSVQFDPRVNDSDPENDPLTVTAVSTPSHGAAYVVAPGTSVQYKPNSGYFGTDSFTYTISDGHGNTATATDTMTVVNRPPTAVNDSFSVVVNTPRTFDPRTNDTDPELDALTITATSTPSHGTVAINSGTSFTYTPASSYTGNDSFTYTIKDVAGNTATATESVTVDTGSQPPVAVNDSIVLNTVQGQSASFKKTFDPRWNDTDPYGYSLTIVGKTNGSQGIVTIGTGGTSVTYTVTNQGYAGSDSFTYTISDGHGHTATATVSVTVNYTGCTTC